MRVCVCVKQNKGLDKQDKGGHLQVKVGVLWRWGGVSIAAGNELVGCGGQ